MLDGLSEESKSTLERRCRWRRFKAGEKVLDQNNTDRDVYFVAEGSVRVVSYSMTGREIALARLQAGGYFGELSAIDGLLRSAAVVALEDCLLGAMDPQVFVNQLIDHPEMARQVMRGLAGIVRGCDERIMDLSTVGAVERVYRQLLELAEEDPDDPDSWLIPALPTNKSIAAMASTSRETASRSIAQLAAGGIVERKGRRLFIHDRERLETLAGVLAQDVAR